MSGSLTQHKALVALSVLLIPSYLLRFSLAGVPTNVLEVTVGLVVLGGFALAPVRSMWKQGIREMPKGVMMLVALFVTAASISTVMSEELRVSLGIVKGWIVTPIVLGFLVYASRRSVVQPLVLSGLLTALLSVFMYESGERLTGVYDVPNSLALWLAPLCVLALWQWLQTRRFWYGVAAVLIAITLLLTQSIAGVGSVVLTIFVGFLLFRGSLPPLSRGPWIAASLIIAATLLFVFSGRFSYLLQSPHDTSIGVRLQLWSVGVELIRESPIAGVGLGQFEPNYQEVLHERFRQYEQGSRATPPIHEFVFRDPHNWPLAFWLNMGLLGLISFIGLHVVAVRNHENQSILLALVVLLLFGLVDTIYWKNDLAALHWVLLASLLPRS